LTLVVASKIAKDITLQFLLLVLWGSQEVIQDIVFVVFLDQVEESPAYDDLDTVHLQVRVH
jgi:hypothetical protein